MEDLAGEGEVNSLTQLLADVDEFQPRKVEELLPDANLPLDTYIIYPGGGHHPFYGVPNTLPRYQQKIWPYVERIKFNKKYKSEKTRNSARKISTRKTDSQVNPFLDNGYVKVGLERETRRTYHTKRGQRWKKRLAFKIKAPLLHRLVALAWVPNPKKKENVCHINDDRTNYLIENLKWGTQSENMRGKQQKGPETMEQKYLNLVNKGFIKG